MTHHPPVIRRASTVDMASTALLSFPIACFSLTVLTDLAYLQTQNLLWLHFSEWLLFAGLVFGVVAAFVMLARFLIRGARPSWASIGVGVIVLLLATLNSLVHTADGITAVMPWGITVSVLTVLVMLVAGWLAPRGARYV